MDETLLPVPAGAPAQLRPQGEDQPAVHQLRDFWSSPGSGRHGRAHWQQTMGSMVLRLLLKGPAWEGASAEEFQVRLCERGLRICNRTRQEASEAFLEESLCGDFPQEVLPRSSWWTFEDNDDPLRRELVLAVHLAKAADGSWEAPFLGGDPADAADLSADWAALRAGRPADARAKVDLAIGKADIFSSFGVSQ